MDAKQMDCLIEKLNKEKEEISKIFNNNTKTFDFLYKDIRKKLLELFSCGAFIFVSMGSLVILYLIDAGFDVVYVTNLSYLILFDCFIIGWLLTYKVNQRSEIETKIRYYRSDEWISYFKDKNQESLMAFRIYVLNGITAKIKHKKNIYEEMKKDYIIECLSSNLNAMEQSKDLKNKLDDIENSITEKIYNLILISQFNNIRSKFKAFGSLAQKIIIAFVLGALVSGVPLIIISNGYNVSFSPLRILIPAVLTGLATFLINYLAQREEVVAFSKLNKFHLPDVAEVGEYSSIKTALLSEIESYICISEEIEKLNVDTEDMVGIGS